jgi:hypothetical protein
VPGRSAIPGRSKPPGNVLGRFRPARLGRSPMPGRSPMLGRPSPPGRKPGVGRAPAPGRSPMFGRFPPARPPLGSDGRVGPTLPGGRTCGRLAIPDGPGLLAGR